MSSWTTRMKSNFKGLKIRKAFVIDDELRIQMYQTQDNGIFYMMSRSKKGISRTIKIGDTIRVLRNRDDFVYFSIETIQELPSWKGNSNLNLILKTIKIV